ncbi:MAG: dihydrofolate reductase [Bacteroidia bacterium]|nr:MAG: dihydrofolate reductase [Bacteroidia bacterium]
MNIIVAVSENGVIGYKGKMPWHLPKDLQYFKKITLNHTVIMGRHTFESIGKPLINRENIVLSTTLKPVEGIHVAKNWDEAIQLAPRDKKIFIIGGQQVFEQALEKKLVHTIYKTVIHHKFDGDTFFPPIDSNKWKLISQEFSHRDEKNPFDFTIEIWQKHEK